MKSILLWNVGKRNSKDAGTEQLRQKKGGADKQSEADIQQHPQTLTANRRDSNVRAMAIKQEIEAIF